MMSKEQLQREIIQHLTEAILRIEQVHNAKLSDLPKGIRTYIKLRDVRLKLAERYGLPEVIYLDEVRND
jgi:hypothetical protein